MFKRDRRPLAASRCSSIYLSRLRRVQARAPGSGESEAELLKRFMTGVFCLAGRTQIGKVLKRMRSRKPSDKKVSALVFVGDSHGRGRRSPGPSGPGSSGFWALPCFMFHEGAATPGRGAGPFQQIARLSGGAFCTFDAGSRPSSCATCCRRSPSIAAGGRPALADYSPQDRAALVPQLTHQIK